MMKMIWCEEKIIFGDLATEWRCISGHTEEGCNIIEYISDREITWKERVELMYENKIRSMVVGNFIIMWRTGEDEFVTRVEVEEDIRKILEELLK
ncbi:MAG: hypothetical protein J6Y29_01550 [Clostridiales bacterium]|nr:hypothetical protein [Clostridiales bacterium]